MLRLVFDLFLKFVVILTLTSSFLCFLFLLKKILNYFRHIFYRPTGFYIWILFQFLSDYLLAVFLQISYSLLYIYFFQFDFELRKYTFIGY